MVLEKGTFFGGRLDRLAGRMKKSAGNTCAVFLDTGAIIDFEREIERWKLKDSRVTPYDFYQDLTSRRMPLYVTVPICGEVLFHHKNHKLSGSPEISGETVELIMSMHQNYLDMLKRERVALRDSEQVGYDTYWASKMVFEEGKSYKDVAGELNIPLGTVMSRLFFARKYVKKLILQYAKINNMQLYCLGRRQYSAVS